MELLSGRARRRILLALMDGRDLPASMLAAEAGVATSTASEHLAKLLDAGLVAVRPQGRHRYYRLRDAEVAERIESLRLEPDEQPRSLKEGNRLALLRAGRTCYDHLAGRLGVALYDAGPALLDELGIVSEPVRTCVDWTERRPHHSGPVGRALAQRLFELGWIERTGVLRAVRVTDEGRRGLGELDLEIDDRRPVDRFQRADA